MPLVKNQYVNLPDDKGTNRLLVVPAYEIPLLEALHVGTKVEVMPLPSNAIHETRYREASLAQEMGRLRLKYQKHPITKNPVFDAVYTSATFREAFEREVVDPLAPGREGSAPAVPDKPVTEETVNALETAKLLTEIRGVGMGAAQELVKAGFYTIQDVAEADLDALIAVSGLGQVSAARIKSEAEALSAEAMGI